MRFAASRTCLLVGAVATGFALPALGKDFDVESPALEVQSPYGTVTSLEEKSKPKPQRVHYESQQDAASQYGDAQAVELFHNADALEKAAFDTVTLPGNVALPSPMITPERDFDPIAGLKNTSSFPLRIVYGESDNEDGSWHNIAAELQSPPALQRKYSAGKCQFELTASAFSVRSHARKSNLEEYAVEKDGYAAQSILRPERSKPLALSVTSELEVQIIADSAAACAKTFANRRIRFASIAIDSSEIVAVEESNKKTIPTRNVVPGNSIDVYLGWDESAGSLKLTDRQGLPAGAQTGVQLLDPESSGVYYLKITPQWTITRFQRTAKLP